GERALPALMAVSGIEGVVEGHDYRDVPVLAAVRAIPGTPWFMVAKVDRSEIYAALRERAWTLSLLVAALALVVMLGIVALWRQRSLRVLERELALQQANTLGELRYRRLVENISDALMIDDLAGRVVYVNDRFLAMFGFEREDIPGLVFDQFCTPAFREQVRTRHQRRIAGEEVETEFEYLALRKDGSEFWVGVRVSKVVEDGRLLGTQSTIQDITERKRAEQVQAALLQISEAAHAASDMADLYRRIHQIISGLLPAENIYVALYDDARDEVSFPYFVDAHDPPPPPQKLGDISLTAVVLRSGRALLLTPEANEDRRRRGEPVVGTSPVEWLGVPLVCKGRTIGVLAVQSYDATVHYAERDKTLLQFVGAQVATAIERKRAEAEVRESEGKFRALFDQSPNLIGLLTLPEGRIVEVNRAALAAFGGRYEDVIGRTSAEIGMWAYEHERDQYLELLTRHGTVHDFEATLRRRNGDTFPVLYNGALVTIGGERYSLNVMQDISERRQTEQRLGESRAAIRNLELALDEHAIVAITDPQGLITYVNDKFCKVSGYGRDEVLGKSHELLNSGYHPQAFFDRMWDTIASGKVWKGEIRNRAKDGTLYWADSTIVPFLDAAGKPYQYVAIRTDITERKRAEEWQRHYAHTLGLITAETPLTAVLESIASFAEQHSDNACCVILLREGQGTRPVRGAAASRAVTEALAAIAAGGAAADTAARQLIQFGHGDGLVEALRQRAQGADVESQEFRACTAEPIIAADRQVLGTLALYQAARTSPRPEHMALLRQSAALAALAVERARHQSDQRLAKVVFEQSVEGIVVSDHADRIVMVNPAFEELTGYTAAGVIGKTPQLLHSDRHDASFYERIGEALARDDWWQGEFWCRRKSGDSLPMLLSVVAVRDAVGAITHRIRVMADISEQKFQAARIEQLAFYDSLTGLPNRALFLDRLEQTLEAARRHGQHGALLFLDLDRFKEINDSQGHAVGDEALVEVARRFVAVSRKEETLARLGGDEFVLIAEGARQAPAALIAERMLRVLAEPLPIAGTTLALAASIGIALYPEDGDSVEDLIKHADIAMYRAKGEGGGFRFYQPVMGESLRKRLSLARRLEHALDDGSLQLHYQPKVSLSTHRPSGAEALLRWHDPELGWVSPSEFIPLAEERGMIGVLGEWVFGEACRQLAAWQVEGHGMVGRLAINLSALQLQSPSIVDALVSQVANAGLDTHAFELELTESSMMADPEGAIVTMDALHRAGFSLAVDDFGTGYSSLVYLKRFAADNIKIDISFVRDMLSDRNDAAIVSTIIAMARNLGLRTTAEGVETAQQAQALLELGCDFAQGYYFGHPEPADTFARRWLRATVSEPTGGDS
ncbi:MAG: PAS domain S-box protein, partial [Xanthomonadaceae bacterium]|nr:PAS domain S-box protein [Xanthomonadaceae bacterium]